MCEGTNFAVILIVVVIEVYEFDDVGVTDAAPLH